jgi:Ni/Co efflux regulator RcnB
LCAGALPAFGQASGLDTNPPDTAAQQGRRPEQARPDARRDREHRQPDRDHRQPDRDHRQPDREHRQPDRRNWDQHGNDRRGHGYGYVVPRPNFRYIPPAVVYSAPPVYYGAPPVYYGAAPQVYYPYATAQLPVNPGDYLAPEYRSQQFVVEDWQWRGLAAPPSGHHWFLIGPDYYGLVADATGQVLSLVPAR